MLNAQIEFSNTETTAPIISFHENLSPASQLIHDRALARAKKYLVAEADLLESIMEVDKDRIYEKWGFTHLTPYCVKYLGLSEEVAATFVRVARKSVLVPELQKAISEGKISVHKAKTIAPVVTSENQEVWIEAAQNSSKDKLEREVAKAFPHAKKPEKAKAKGPDRVRVEYDMSEEAIAFFRRAQDLVSQKSGKSANLSETQDELLKCYLDKYDPLRKAKRAENRERPKVETKTIDAINNDRSREQSPHKKPRAKLKSAVIHELNQRDQAMCQAKLADGSNCGQKRWLHVHHIKPVSEGGSDATENLITLCSSHHRIWHSTQLK